MGKGNNGRYLDVGSPSIHVYVINLVGYGVEGGETPKLPPPGNAKHLPLKSRGVQCWALPPPPRPPGANLTSIHGVTAF